MLTWTLQLSLIILPILVTRCWICGTTARAEAMNWFSLIGALVLSAETRSLRTRSELRGKCSEYVVLIIKSKLKQTHMSLRTGFSFSKLTSIVLRSLAASSGDGKTTPVTSRIWLNWSKSLEWSKGLPCSSKTAVESSESACGVRD